MNRLFLWLLLIWGITVADYIVNPTDKYVIIKVLVLTVVVPTVWENKK
jgi:hypothetical protein